MPANHRALYALSRFFFAQTGAEMQSAWALLEGAPAVDDWDSVEYGFNRLFVGPAALSAPPYASVYLDGTHRQVMGQTTTRIRELYQALGLASPWLNKIPDDHLALELDALWQVLDTYQRLPGEPLRQAAAYLCRHLLRWVPRFVEQVRHADAVHPALLYVTDRLLETLQAEDTRASAPASGLAPCAA